ncbi:MAG: c-type cytochrome [Casimicrobiaceae bacterium]
MTRTRIAHCFSVAVLAGMLHGCGEKSMEMSLQPTGNPEQGRRAILHYGCGACHRITGIAGADGNVGPPLIDMMARVYLAGVLANTPANMAHWIRSPQEVSPMTAMPDMQVTQEDAEAMTAYLYHPD